VGFGGPHDQGTRQREQEHRGFDQYRVNFYIAVIGQKEEGQSPYERRAYIENFYGRVGFFGVGTGQFQKIADKVDYNHALHEQKVILLVGLSPKKSVDPYEEGQSQGYADNYYQ